jgi:hypothetical protein
MCLLPWAVIFTLKFAVDLEHHGLYEGMAHPAQYHPGNQPSVFMNKGKSPGYHKNYSLRVGQRSSCDGAII